MKFLWARYLESDYSVWKHNMSLANSISTCNIAGVYGGDYEECRLLGYKNPVRTSQETNYVSATESSQLMLCKI
jgi:hypothetical protein